MTETTAAQKNSSIPRPEFPRPDFERSQWINLNGEWDFDFDDEDAGESEQWFINKKLQKKITVPFCYQSKMSGIHDTSSHEVIWYKREFSLPEEFSGKRVILNFGAVDFEAKVWVNGTIVCMHRGGNVPFKADITKCLIKGINVITVRVRDTYEITQPRGKQDWKEKPDRIRYTNTSGIWQTVWLEAVGAVYLDRVRFTPNVDASNVNVEVFLDRYPFEMELDIEISFKGKIVKKIKTTAENRIFKITADIRHIDPVQDAFHCWTPERPNLFDVKMILSKDGRILDEVSSYFGMRKISIKGDMIYLNNHPLYQKLVLDQGYWEESLMTPPSDEAIKLDIELTKQLGFNGARKHQKMEDPRYYYWADKLGLILWGEMASAIEFNTEAMENTVEEWVDFINRDYNHPCIITWVPLNESWGVRNIRVDPEQQNYARSLYYMTKAMDKTRLVSTNDGWEQVTSDICGIHDYTAWGEDFTPKYLEKETVLAGSPNRKMVYAEGEKYEGQPVLITEYGGIAFASESKEKWGYHEAVRDEESFLKRYESITSAIKGIPYIQGYCYTQLTDTFQEANGLLTMDRKFKVDADRVKKINK